MKIKQVVVAMSLLVGMQAFAVVRADVSFSGAAQAPAERLSLWYRRARKQVDRSPADRERSAWRHDIWGR